MGNKRSASSVNKPSTWLLQQSTKVKALMAVACMLCALAALKLLIRNHDMFFIASETIHFLGILVLIYKLSTLKTCSGLSLKTQELTAVFLASRLTCSVYLEGDVHTFLDFLTLVSTLWVIYMMRVKLRSTYMAELDNMPLCYLAAISLVLAILVHPYTTHLLVCRILWAFAVYLESVSVLPQLQMLHNTKMIEPFTAHYVFALGVARFLGCAHWIIKVYDSAGKYLFLVGTGYIWLPMVLLSEIVQTFILADFVYYYVKGAISGQLMVSLPLPV